MIFKSPVKFSDSTSHLKLINQWKCFGCCHVRTATTIVGLWHLAIHIMGFFLFIVAHYIVPSYYCEFPTLTSYPHITRSSSDLSVEKIENDDYDSYLNSDVKSINAERGNSVWMVMSLVSLVATVLLIYGAMKKKSLFILPFFFLQIFDVLFDITIIGVYVAVSSSIAEFFGELYNAPFQQFLLHFGFYQKIVFTCVYVLLALFIKVYLICIVYLCYRYLTNIWKYDENETMMPVNGNENVIIK